MELSIDTASEVASVALSQEGDLIAEITWRCRRNHTVELLPSIETLLMQAGSSKDSLSAVFACTGPGMYTGLRVGISVAQGLARAHSLPALGIGRLELDAYPHAAFPGAIIATHRAGRGDIAWAAYRGDPWREIAEPQLSRPAELAREVNDRTLFVGEVDQTLAAALKATAGDRAVITTPAASHRRAATLAHLGFSRLSAGEDSEAALLRPIYLRPPVIGPQEKAGG
jgi:tRNA threonylcarbamoyladenosine biosynthesis protein TsaB